MARSEEEGEEEFSFLGPPFLLPDPERPLSRTGKFDRLRRARCPRTSHSGSALRPNSSKMKKRPRIHMLRIAHQFLIVRRRVSPVASDAQSMTVSDALRKPVSERASDTVIHTASDRVSCRHHLQERLKKANIRPAARSETRPTQRRTPKCYPTPRPPSVTAPSHSHAPCAGSLAHAN
jgi:hypothetical protein